MADEGGGGGKKFPLEIVLRAVDRATGIIRRVQGATERLGRTNKSLETTLKPFADFREQTEKLKENLQLLGTDVVAQKFGNLKSVLGQIVGVFALVAGAVGAAIAGFRSLVDHFDNLGDAAERINVSADALAQLRYAAAQSGAEVEQLESGFEAFQKSLGQARIGTGRLTSFLQKASPALLRQLKGAKSNEEAFGLMAEAVKKVRDPATKAALATAAFGGAGAALLPLLNRGRAGVFELMNEYLVLAGSQKGAVDAAGEVDSAMHQLNAAIDGVKAVLVEGLGPAFTAIIGQLREFFSENREQIGEWAVSLGKRIPAAVGSLTDSLGTIVDVIGPVWKAIGGLKTILIALAAVLGVKLIIAIGSLSIALVTTPVGWLVTAIAGLITIGLLLVENWDSIAAFFTHLWENPKEALIAFLDVVKWLIPVVGLIIKYWEPITDFFVAIWDGIKAAFAAAWDFIGGIIDAILGAVDRVKEAAASVAEFFDFGGDDETVPAAADLDQAGLDAMAAGATGSRRRRLPINIPFVQQSATAAAPTARSEAHVTVEFSNMPPGARVTTDPRSTTEIDVATGYQMGFP